MPRLAYPIVLLAIAVLAALVSAPPADAQRLTQWSMPEDVSAPVTEGRDLSGVLICDPYQNLHILWGKSHDRGSEIFYRTDVGGTLSPPLDVVAMSDPLAIRLSSALNEHDSTLHVIWQNSYIRGDVYYSRAPLASAGEPGAWEEPRIIVSHVDSAGVTADATGALHLFYGSSTPDGMWNTVYRSQSDDNGLTWSDPEVVYDTGSDIPSTIGGSASVGPRGRIHVGITIRSQDYGVYSELGYVRSLDRGQTWEPYQLIAEQSEETPNVSVIAPFVFGPDEVHLTWHDPRRMHAWSYDGGDTWSNPIQIIQLGAGFGGANALAKDSAGVLRVATGVKNGVYVARFLDTQWGDVEQIDSRSMDPHGQRLVVCQGNQLHILYDDRVEDDTTVWYAHKQVNAPHIEQSPIPASTITSAAGSESTDSLEPSPTPPPVPTSDPVSSLNHAPPPTTSNRPLMPLLISTISVLALMTVAVAWRGLRPR